MDGIKLVPCETPITNPVFDTTATDGVDEVHGVVLCGVAEPVNCVIDPTQTNGVPNIVGNGITVTVTVCVQPLAFL